MLVSCVKKSPDKTYTIEMVRVDGVKIVEQYTLPENAILFIDSDRGSYCLTFNQRCSFGCTQARGFTIREAVVDFKVISIK